MPKIFKNCPLVCGDSGRRKNVAAYSVSATTEHTTGVLVEWAEMEWFTQESSRLEPRKWKKPATLPAFGRERYEASDKTRRIISEALQSFRPDGWADT
jgi:hypothetical protein